MLFDRLPITDTGDRQADVDAIVATFTRRLEDEVRRIPGQYFWHHRRWKRQPPRRCRRCEPCITARRHGYERRRVLASRSIGPPASLDRAPFSRLMRSCQYMPRHPVSAPSAPRLRSIVFTVLGAALIAACGSDGERARRRAARADATDTAPPRADAVDSAPRFIALTAGRQFTCGVDQRGGAWCWGDNRLGQLGLGDTLDRFVPTPLQHSVPFLRVTAGETHACAVDSLAATHCWGDNGFFALGDSLVKVRARPGTLPFGTLRSLAAGAHFTCALTARGNARCWGANTHGELGDSAVRATARGRRRRAHLASVRHARRRPHARLRAHAGRRCLVLGRRRLRR